MPLRAPEPCLLAEFLAAQALDAAGLQSREALRQHLEGVLRPRVGPGATLFIFGSSANSLGTRDSDLDLCLDVPEAHAAGSCSRQRQLCIIAQGVLHAAGYTSAQAVPAARVPIVKFSDARTGLRCDLCFNNMPAVHNSRLLLHYMRIDPRVRLLALAVKHWAKARAVVGTREGFLSSYALVLLVVFFAQQQRLLPSLSYCRHHDLAEPSAGRRWNMAGSEAGQLPLSTCGGDVVEYNGRTCDCRFMQPTDDEIAEYMSSNEQAASGSSRAGVGTLLLQFFRFVQELLQNQQAVGPVGHREHPDVVSIQHARLLTRNEAWGGSCADNDSPARSDGVQDQEFENRAPGKPGHRRKRGGNKSIKSKANGLHRNILSIQDPFNQAHDVGRPLRNHQCELFRRQLLRAEALLTSCTDGQWRMDEEPQPQPQQPPQPQPQQQPREAREEAWRDADLQRRFLERVCDTTDPLMGAGMLRSNDETSGQWKTPKKTAAVGASAGGQDVRQGLVTGRPQRQCGQAHAAKSHLPGKYCCPECGCYFAKWTACRTHLVETNHCNAQLGMSKEAQGGGMGLQQRCMVF
jgi:hypothetical protein